MTDTRPALTEAQFEEEASYVENGWWMTGENLIHVPSVMNVKGWNLYGHPSQALLTPAQRTLLMWSDIVGQTSNGGFLQFCDNYAPNLALGVAAVEAIEWPELREKFRRAIAEQAGDADNPKLLRPVPLSDDPEKWKESRKRLIRYLASKEKSRWQLITARKMTLIEARFEEWELKALYQEAVVSGELPSGGERVFDFVWPPTQEADAFDSWFYSDATIEASASYIQSFIIRNREQLYRPL